MNAQSQPNNKPNGVISGTTNIGNMSFLTLLAAASSLDLAAKSSSNRAQVNDGKQNATYPSSPFLSLKKKTKLSAGTFSDGHSSSDANLSVTQRIVSSVAPKQQRQQQKSKKAKPPKPTFPEELMRMVSDESNASIITFLPCGKRFIILDKDAFVNDVLPKSALAMQTPSGGRVKISSFTRRLNRWGFLQCRVPGLENELVSKRPMPSLTTYVCVISYTYFHYLTFLSRLSSNFVSMPVYRSSPIPSSFGTSPRSARISSQALSHQPPNKISSRVSPPRPFSITAIFLLPPEMRWKRARPPRRHRQCRFTCIRPLKEHLPYPRSSAIVL